MDSTKMGKRKPVAGISCLCQDPEGNIIGTRYSPEERYSDLRDRKYVYGLKGEHWGMMLTSVVRQFPFPEVKGFVPEGLVWMEIAKHYDDLCINEPLRVYYDTPESLTTHAKWSRGWVLYHRTVVRRDWMYFLHAPLRIGYSVLISLLGPFVR